MTAAAEIAVATFFLAVGAAGPPLEPLRILLAAVVCAAVWRAGRFVGAIAMAATILAGWLQHGELRLSLLATGTALGAAAHFLYRRPRAATALMAIGAIAGLGLLFFG